MATRFWTPLFQMSPNQRQTIIERLFIFQSKSFSWKKKHLNYKDSRLINWSRVRHVNKYLQKYRRKNLVNRILLPKGLQMKQTRLDRAAGLHSAGEWLLDKTARTEQVGRFRFHGVASKDGWTNAMGRRYLFLSFSWQRAGFPGPSDFNMLAFGSGNVGLLRDS